MMLSISTLRAVDYYTEAVTESFDYYESAKESGDPPGQWFGKLANRWFGQSSTVSKPEFAALFFGCDPITDKPLTRTADELGYENWKIRQQLNETNLSPDVRKALRSKHQALSKRLLDRDAESGRNHRAGIDLTFSAPKDFSLLVAAACPEERKRLLGAWRNAVLETLTTAEKKYAQTRLNDETGLRNESIAGSAVAIFEHLTARPVEGHPPDPDAHLHCVMFSPVLCHDVKTRALFSNDLRLNLKVLDAEARARLAQELAGFGYSLVEDRQQNCVSFHLAGVTPEERQHFSKRRGEIVTGLANGQFKKSSLAAIGTRSGKGDWTRGDALEAWQMEFSSIGITEDRFRNAKVDQPLEARSEKDIVDGLLAKKSYFTTRDLRQALWEEAQFIRLPKGTDLGNWIEERANRLLKSADILRVKLPDGSMASSQRTASGDREPIFTTRSLLKREFDLDETVQVLGMRGKHRIDWSTALPLIRMQEAEKTRAAKTEFELQGDPIPDDFKWSYRPDQLAAVAKILEGPDVGFIQAFAGTGKTTAAHALIDVYKQNGFDVVALAPSNKAANQLSEDCHLAGAEKALTVDAFLLSKARERINSRSVIFVDEASMIGFDHAEELISIAQARGAKIVFQGDKEQLPSVGRGRFFANCVEKRLGSDAVELTVITRQRSDWGKVATEASARGDFAESIQLLEKHNALHTEGTEESLLNRIARDHLSDKQPNHQKLIVASRNADVAVLNKMIRAELVANGTLEDGLPCVVGKEKNRTVLIGKGERILFTDTLKDGRKKLVSNGALGTVQSVTKTASGATKIRVQIDGNPLPVEFSSDEFSGFQHGYAISIHKSQGATVESCRYLFSEFVSSELAYVAMSRHRSTFGLYCRESQRSELSKWMGRKLEKLDARELIPVDDFNQLADLEHGIVRQFGSKVRRYLADRMPFFMKRACKRQELEIPEYRAPSFQSHIEKLGAFLLRLRNRNPQPKLPQNHEAEPEIHVLPQRKEVRRPRI